MQLGKARQVGAQGVHWLQGEMRGEVGVKCAVRSGLNPKPIAGCKEARLVKGAPSSDLQRGGARRARQRQRRINELAHRAVHHPRVKALPGVAELEIDACRRDTGSERVRV